MKLKKDHPERRQERRVQIEAPIGIAVVKWPLSLFVRQPQFHAALRDASNSGMLCVLGNAVKPASKVSLWLEVEVNNRKRQLRLTGTVAWTRPDEKSGKHLVGIHLNPRPAKEVNAWLRVMIDELRLHDGASPL